MLLEAEPDLVGQTWGAPIELQSFPLVYPFEGISSHSIVGFMGEHRWGSKDQAACRRAGPGTDPISCASVRGLGGRQYRLEGPSVAKVAAEKPLRELIVSAHHVIADH